MRNRMLTSRLVAIFSALSVLLAFATNRAVNATLAAQEIADYRSYATSHAGDADRGRAVFLNEKTAACVKCHSVDGSRRGVGPDLSAVGNKFDRAGLIRSVLEPSSSIAIGYGTCTIVTTEGNVFEGVLQRVADDFIEIKDKDSKAVRIESGLIEEQKENAVSLMPDGMQKLISRDEFCDLLAYLQTLKQAEMARSEFPGDVREIDRASVGGVLQRKFAALKPWFHPVGIETIPHRESEYFVLEHDGRIEWVRQKGGSEISSQVLNLRHTVRVGGATGLLGLACHPKFDQDPRVFVKYQKLDGNRIITIVEQRTFRETTEGEAELVEPLELLAIPAVTQDHNGGSVAFGPDGYLYIGMGDSGPQRDPRGHGQDLKTFLGKILRINIDHQNASAPYTVPTDNPFVDVAESKPEIWAFGFREPWRISFDSVTKELWVGDVGQDRIEEVAIVQRGENHGWNVYEGFTPFSEQHRNAQPEERRNFIRPVLSYPRSMGVSVTGGYVYRGTRSPQLYGWYIFGDFESRRIWAVKQSDRVMEQAIELGRLSSRLVSFGQQADGEICCVSYDDGQIYQLVLDDVRVEPVTRQIVAETSESVPVPWRVSMTRPAAGWEQDDFDDSNWRQAPGGFGSPGTPGGEIRTDWRGADIWLRRKFQLARTPAEQTQLFLRIHHDEDSEVFLNGVQVARLNRWTTGYVEIPLSKEDAARLREGMNTLAIHCHQNGGGQYIDCGIVGYERPGQN